MAPCVLFEVYLLRETRLAGPYGTNKGLLTGVNSKMVEKVVPFSKHQGALQVTTLDYCLHPLGLRMHELVYYELSRVRDASSDL